jgi:PAP2 superfamily
MQAAGVALILLLVAGLLHIAAGPYISFALTGAFVMLLMLRPSRWDIAAVTGSAAIFAAVYFLNHGELIDFYGVGLAIPGAFLGMGSLLLVTVQWLWAPESTKRFHLERARDVVLIPALCLCSAIAVNIAARVTPITYDRFLYAFDLKFGGPPAWVVGGWLRAHPWLFEASGYVYNSLPLGLAAGLAIQWRDRLKNAPILVDLRWVFITLGVTGFVLYQVCPAAGPVYLFRPQFPATVPSLASFVIEPAWMPPVARNAMPSLHVGWTLLLFWNLRRRNRWIGVIWAAYLTLTALATLGYGEHYLADLMVAPALAVAVQAACTRTDSRVRWLALAIGSSITLAWLIAFRTAAALWIPAGPVVWSLAFVSVALPSIAAWRLERAALTDPPGFRRNGR